MNRILIRRRNRSLRSNPMGYAESTSFLSRRVSFQGSYRQIDHHRFGSRSLDHGLILVCWNHHPRRLLAVGSSPQNPNYRLPNSACSYYHLRRFVPATDSSRPIVGLPKDLPLGTDHVGILQFGIQRDRYTKRWVRRTDHSRFDGYRLQPRGLELDLGLATRTSMAEIDKPRSCCQSHPLGHSIELARPIGRRPCELPSQRGSARNRRLWHALRSIVGLRDQDPSVSAAESQLPLRGQNQE